MRKPTYSIKPAHIRIALAAMLLAILLLTNAIAADDSYEDLAKLITSNEDDRMDAQDLAFLLVTHNFDATPKGDHVEVKIGNSVYSLMPNASKPGLAEIKAPATLAERTTSTAEMT
jgi:hypothetical protein